MMGLVDKECAAHLRHAVLDFSLGLSGNRHRGDHNVSAAEQLVNVFRRFRNVFQPQNNGVEGVS
jgi:hypothetical protein